MRKKTKVSRKENKQYLQELYNKAYLSGYEDCKRAVTFGLSAGAFGYRKGYKDKQQVMKIQKRYDKIKNSIKK